MKRLKDQNVLFFTRTMGLGGTENVILQLCEILKSEVNKLIVCSCGGVNTDKLDKLGIKHYEINDITDKSPLTIIKNTIVLKTIVSKENITAIHCHHRMAAFYVSLLKLYKRCLFITTCHNTFHDKRYLTHFSYKHCHLIACGEMVKENLINDFNLSKEQVTVIHNAVKAFDGNVVVDPLIKEFHDEGCFVVGNIGRLSKQKGMEYFIESIPKVIKAHPNTRFVVAGTGEDEEKLKKLSVKLNVNNYLLFLGYRSDIQNLMSQIDLIVLSSLWEGLPLTPIEAFSVGKTIVATSIDGTPEVVKNGANGLLVPPGNSEELSNAIMLMIENPEERKFMEGKAAETYKNSFSFDIFAKNYIQFYRKSS